MYATDLILSQCCLLMVPQRQQAGRAGRRSRDSLVVLVPESFAIDQYYANNPEDLFTGQLGDLTVDIDSKVVLEGVVGSASTPRLCSE